MKPRLPPGQKLTKRMAIFSIEPTPYFDGEHWDLTLSGAINNPKSLSWHEFNSMTQTSLNVDFHCVTTWSLFDTIWEGVLFKDLYELADPKPEVNHVLIKARSNYSTNLPLKDAIASNVILATKYNNQPIEAKHGAPLRLVVPDKYAYKACKWVSEIIFLKDEQLGYWEQRGYSNFADPWREQRYSSDDSDD
ncbi:MAG: molybdopterin-dependent oxidoreductase [Candidatus Hodarchaeales archaeon]